MASGAAWTPCVTCSCSSRSGDRGAMEDVVVDARDGPGGAFWSPVMPGLDGAWLAKALSDAERTSSEPHATRRASWSAYTDFALTGRSLRNPICSRGRSSACGGSSDHRPPRVSSCARRKWERHTHRQWTPSEPTPAERPSCSNRFVAPCLLRPSSSPRRPPSTAMPRRERSTKTGRWLPRHAQAPRPRPR